MKVFTNLSMIYPFFERRLNTQTECSAQFRTQVKLHIEMFNESASWVDINPNTDNKYDVDA